VTELIQIAPSLTRMQVQRHLPHWLIASLASLNHDSICAQTESWLFSAYQCN